MLHGGDICCYHNVLTCVFETWSDVQIATQFHASLSFPKFLKFINFPKYYAITNSDINSDPEHKKAASEILQYSGYKISAE